MKKFKVHKKARFHGPKVDQFVFCNFCGRVEFLHYDTMYTNAINEMDSHQYKNGWSSIALDHAEHGLCWESRTACPKCTKKLEKGQEVDIVDWHKGRRSGLNMLAESIKRRLDTLTSKEEYSKDIATEQCEYCQNINSTGCHTVHGSDELTTDSCKRNTTYGGFCYCPGDNSSSYYKSNNKFIPISYEEWKKLINR